MSDDYGMDIDINKVSVNTKIMKLSKKYGKVQTIELKKRDPFLPPNLEQELRENLVKMRAITPTEIARKNDIRVSTVKKLLSDMAEDGLLHEIASTSRLKVYQGKDAK